MSRKQKYYVVWKGRKAGVFASWDECSAQVTGYPGAEYKSFGSREAAQAALRGSYQDYQGQRVLSLSQQSLLAVGQPVLDSYSVDAACSGNPGLLEYRCVRTETGQEIFRQGPFEHGTNNVGEFLALVHVLALLVEKGIGWPVYSDSRNAIGWVKEKRCKTRLERDERNDDLFKRIEWAEVWLATHEYPNKILKWKTEAWGEIPADFGRK